MTMLFIRVKYGFRLTTDTESDSKPQNKVIIFNIKCNLVNVLVRRNFNFIGLREIFGYFTFSKYTFRIGKVICMHNHFLGATLLVSNGDNTASKKKMKNVFEF